MPSIAEVNDNTLKLQSFVESQENGKVLLYSEIQTLTGILMDDTGKQFLRSALKRARIEYTCKKGVGIQLASAAIALPILSTRLTRISKAVKRGDRSQRILQEKFLGELPPEEQRRLRYIGAVFGAINLATEEGRLLYKKNANLLQGPVVHIPMPKL